MSERFPLVIVSGGFDPIHKGHIEHILEASELGNVIILLNSDAWLIRKKGKNFMDWKERAIICGAIRGVVDVIDFDDSDGSACKGIEKVVKTYISDKYIFAKGGDRNADNIPEIPICKKLGVEIIYDIGKSGKIQSSSSLLNNYYNNEYRTSDK